MPASFNASSRIRERHLPGPGVLIIDKVPGGEAGTAQRPEPEINGVR
jgi:hypothetical protein